MEKREVLLDTKVVEAEIDGEKILKPIEEMKNSSSRRSLPIPAPVYEMPVEQKAQQDRYRRMFKGSYNRAYHRAAAAVDFFGCSSLATKNHSMPG